MLIVILIHLLSHICNELFLKLLIHLLLACKLLLHIKIVILVFYKTILISQLLLLLIFIFNFNSFFFIFNLFVWSCLDLILEGNLYSLKELTRLLENQKVNIWSWLQDLLHILISTSFDLLSLSI